MTLLNNPLQLTSHYFLFYYGILNQNIMSLLVLVRHGQSVYNEQNRFTGSLDIELTQLGEDEARQTGEKLKSYSFAIAYTSMLMRAQESLRIILEVIGQTEISIIKNSALNERSYGSLQGLNKEEIAKKYGAEQVAQWRRSYEMSPPEGESLAQTYDRTIPFYKAEIEPKLKKGTTILIVGHGNSLRALMMYLENFSASAIAGVTIPTGMPRVYDMDKDLKIKSVKYL